MTSTPLVRMLTDAGYGSRRDVAQLINAGLVQVNGRLASSYTEKVDPEKDSIVVTGHELARSTARRVYVMLNKPEGYLSTTEDDRDRPTVLDLLPEEVRAAGLHPAGRLDEDSTGLLVLTNDGQLTYQLTHPRFEHEKEYWVATTGRLTDADVEKLEQGVEIDGEMTRPARVRILLGQSPYTYSVTIHEGRKRQVRMMFAAINHQVALLRRVRVGGLLLGDLHEGSWRELSADDLKVLLLKRPRDVRQSGVGRATPLGAAQLASVPKTRREPPRRNARPEARTPSTTRRTVPREYAGGPVGRFAPVRRPSPQREEVARTPSPAAPRHASSQPRFGAGPAGTSRGEPRHYDRGPARPRTERRAAPRYEASTGEPYPDRFRRRRSDDRPLEGRRRDFGSFSEESPMHRPDTRHGSRPRGPQSPGRPYDTSTRRPGRVAPPYPPTRKAPDRPGGGQRGPIQGDRRDTRQAEGRPTPPRAGAPRDARYSQSAEKPRFKQVGDASPQRRPPAPGGRGRPPRTSPSAGRRRPEARR